MVFGRHCLLEQRVQIAFVRRSLLKQLVQMVFGRLCLLEQRVQIAFGRRSLLKQLVVLNVQTSMSFETWEGIDIKQLNLL